MQKILWIALILLFSLPYVLVISYKVVLQRNIIYDNVTTLKQSTIFAYVESYSFSKYLIIVYQVCYILKGFFLHICKYNLKFKNS